MVHRGPSQGCGKCKARHIKCDLNTPECFNCIRKGVECPGFGHKLDTVIRNQTSKIKSFYTKPIAKRPKLVPAAVCPEWTLPKPVFEEGARGWFFSTFSSTHRDWSASHGHLDLVLPRFKNSDPDSLLALTVTWLSVLLLGVSIRGKPYTLEYEILSKIIRLLNEIITKRSPGPAGCENLFLVIILLQFGEDIRARRYFEKPNLLYMHQQIAENFVRHGLGTEQSATSRCLITAVRNNALCYNFIEPTRNFDYELWSGCGSTLVLHDTDESPATKLDAYGASLLALQRFTTRLDDCRQWLEPETPRSECLTILHELQLWEEAVPDHWKPQRRGRLHHIYPGVEVCYLFAQCFWLQLKALAMLLAQCCSSDASNPRLEQHALNLFDKMMGLECSFTGQTDLRSESVTVGFQDVSEPLPCATVLQSRESVLGSRFLDITLRIFDNILQEFTGPKFSDVILQRTSVCRAWALRELQTIRLAFPVINGNQTSAESKME